jgi:hypothetical protein
MNGNWCPWFPHFLRDFAIGRPQFLIVFSYRSCVFLRINLLIDFATRLNSVLHPGSLVSCHSFLSSRFSFNRQSNPGMSLFRVGSLILQVDSPCAESVVAVKSYAALSASSPELISFLGDIKSGSRIWNRSQHVDFDSVLPFSGQSLSRWPPPHHKQRGGSLQFAQTWPKCWQL